MLGSIAELLRVPPGLGFRGTWTGVSPGLSAGVLVCRASRGLCIGRVLFPRMPRMGEV